MAGKNEGGVTGRAVGVAAILEIYRRFYELLPEAMLWVEDPTTQERLPVIPGELRSRDVAVGRHIPISAPAVPRFLRRFEEVYIRLGRAETILAAAAAHHWLAWIPVPRRQRPRGAVDVARDAARSARHRRSVVSRARPRSQCRRLQGPPGSLRQTRRNDLDGRGHLSEEALAEFTRFFLTTWAARRRRWRHRHRGPSGAPRCLGADRARRGRLGRHARAAAPGLSGTLASRWMPGLFPDRSTQ